MSGTRNTALRIKSRKGQLCRVPGTLLSESRAAKGSYVGYQEHCSQSQEPQRAAMSGTRTTAFRVKSHKGQLCRVPGTLLSESRAAKGSYVGYQEHCSQNQEPQRAAMSGTRNTALRVKSRKGQLCQVPGPLLSETRAAKGSYVGYQEHCSQSQEPQRAAMSGTRNTAFRVKSHKGQLCRVPGTLLSESRAAKGSYVGYKEHCSQNQEQQRAAMSGTRNTALRVKSRKGQLCQVPGPLLSESRAAKGSYVGYQEHCSQSQEPQRAAMSGTRNTAFRVKSHKGQLCRVPGTLLSESRAAKGSYVGYKEHCSQNQEQQRAAMSGTRNTALRVKSRKGQLCQVPGTLLSESRATKGSYVGYQEHCCQSQEPQRAAMSGSRNTAVKVERRKGQLYQVPGTLLSESRATKGSNVGYQEHCFQSQQPQRAAMSGTRNTAFRVNSRKGQLFRVPGTLLSESRAAKGSYVGYQEHCSQSQEQKR
ncbi:hypothetical protein NDU88_008204 [Pleurodeles waltl]|uniref:Uncharacterized protein n=1 Tax=Pleurodeles waltl TaxID=8319 RepID=A0AAV7U2X8_PLEWA|nr:hypothetical protein NDU88_008204 [Pleurodeles waltl]